MNKKVSFFNFSINKIISRDQPILDQARIRLLYYGFFIVFVAVAGLLISVYFQRQHVLTITSAVVLAGVTFLFKYLTYKPDWRQISHTLLISATLINLNNVFITLQKVDIITIQVILLIILFSYYMLGQSWGLFYSLINLIPVLTFLVISYNAGYFIPFRAEVVDQATVIISVFANFIIIVYIHSHFYNAFINNIKQLNETSEGQKKLNRQLEQAIEKVEKSSQVKTDFLSTMSHEIRTPLNAVIGMSNVMMMADPRPDQIENLDVLKFSANNLLSIVNDVLDFNKIESGNVVFESTRFDLVELMENICGAEILKAEQKGLSFTLKVDPLLRNKLLLGDPTRISQIIFNLVSNAIKFTKQGNIWVRASCYEDRGNTIIVSFIVKDTGIGIEEANLQSIFEPFTQESMTTTRQYGGTGLGLAIVKRLLELQGLHMHVASKIGQGSEFSFKMEFALTDAVQEKTDNNFFSPGSDNLSALQVLIAEDNPVNVLLMKKLLGKWNIKPIFAENGERAIVILQSNNFDIILMDLQMPVMNGFDAAKEIRKLPDPKKAGVPIIALTAAALYDIKEQVMSAGMNDYVSKPFKPEELLEKIQGLIVVAN